MTKKLLLLLPSLLVAGCASLDGAVDRQADAIAIEKVDSRWARVGVVTLWPAADGLRIRGELQRRLVGPGPIYGHLHVEVVDARGRILYRVAPEYRRQGVKARSAKFVASLPVEPSQAAAVRVTHHWKEHG